MRDYYSHTELILAGMWGGCTGVFHQVEALISDYIHSGRYLNTRVMDQHFYVIVSGQPYVRVS